MRQARSSRPHDFAWRRTADSHAARRRLGLTCVCVLLGCLSITARAHPVEPGHSSATISNVTAEKTPDGLVEGVTQGSVARWQLERRVQVLSQSAQGFETRYAAIGAIESESANLSQIFATNYTISFDVEADPGTQWALALDIGRFGQADIQQNRSEASSSVLVESLPGFVAGANLLEGSLHLPRAGDLAIASTPGLVSVPFSQETYAEIRGIGSGSVTLSFGNPRNRMNSQGGEVAIRMGLGDRLFDFATGEYPGIGERTAADDGHFVRARLTPVATDEPGAVSSSLFIRVESAVGGLEDVETSLASQTTTTGDLSAAATAFAASGSRVARSEGSAVATWYGPASGRVTFDFEHVLENANFVTLSANSDLSVWEYEFIPDTDGLFTVTWAAETRTSLGGLLSAGFDLEFDGVVHPLVALTGTLSLPTFAGAEHRVRIGCMSWCTRVSSGSGPGFSAVVEGTFDWHYDVLTPVEADAGPDQTVECTSPAGTEIVLDGSGSSGPPGRELTFTWIDSFGTAQGVTPTVTLPPGVHPITLVVEDPLGLGDEDTTSVTVQDTTPPRVEASTEPDVLWPPNRKMVRVPIAVDASDSCDPQPPECRVVGVRSNEPEDARGDGRTGLDGSISGPLEVLLRAEAAGGGAGRVYTATVACTDADGNEATAEAEVYVPHDRRGRVDRSGIRFGRGREPHGPQLPITSLLLGRVTRGHERSRVER